MYGVSARVDTAGIDGNKVTPKRAVHYIESHERMRCAFESGYVSKEVGGARRRLPHKAIRSRPEPSTQGRADGDNDCASAALALWHSFEADD